MRVLTPTLAALALTGALTLGGEAEARSVAGTIDPEVATKALTPVHHRHWHHGGPHHWYAPPPRYYYYAPPPPPPRYYYYAPPPPPRYYYPPPPPPGFGFYFKF